MQLRLKVNGMHCKSCEELIKEDLQDINVKAEVNHKTGIVDVNFNDKEVKLNRIKEVIEKLGYNVE